MQPILGPTSHLDRLSDQRSDRDHMDALMDADTSRYFVLAGGKPVVDSNEDRTGGNLRWFSRSDLDAMGVPMMEVLFLGLEPGDGHALFAVSVTEHFARHAPEAEGRLLPPVDLRSLAAQGSLSEQELGIAAQAVALHNWHEENRCCGRCGGSMSPRNGGWKRRCWACKNEVFPRMDPVVIMAVRHGDKILLAHEERFPESMFSTIAGYVEPGDDIINAVRRETMEEVGLRAGLLSLPGPVSSIVEHPNHLGRKSLDGFGHTRFLAKECRPALATQGSRCPSPNIPGLQERDDPRLRRRYRRHP